MTFPNLFYILMKFFSRADVRGSGYVTLPNIAKKMKKANKNAAPFGAACYKI